MAVDYANLYFGRRWTLDLIAPPDDGHGVIATEYFHFAQNISLGHKRRGHLLTLNMYKEKRSSLLFCVRILIMRFKRIYNSSTEHFLMCTRGTEATATVKWKKNSLGFDVCYRVINIKHCSDHYSELKEFVCLQLNIIHIYLLKVSISIEYLIWVCVMSSYHSHINVPFHPHRITFVWCMRWDDCINIPFGHRDLSASSASATQGVIAPAFHMDGIQIEKKLSHVNILLSS